jgi:MFS family permease
MNSGLSIINALMDGGPHGPGFDAPLPVRAQQRWTLLAVCLAALALPLSFSAGAVAVPALARSAAASPTALAWVTNAFMLTFGSLLLAAGGLADRYGRRLFLLGTAGFTTATAVVCLAPTLLWLDLARGLQGVAAAAALASGTAALAQAWQGPARARVFALLGTFGAGLAGAAAWACCCRHWDGAACSPRAVC